MKASELLAGLSVDGLKEDFEVSGVSSDSRRINKGDLFICLSGSRRDGHDFVGEAIQRGAAFVLAAHPVQDADEGKLLLTPDTRRAEAFIRCRLAGNPTDGMKTVAVTGTAGKTSVTQLLAHVLKGARKKVGVISTVGCYSMDRLLTLGDRGGSSVSDLHGAMTTPDPEYFFSACAQMKRDGCEYLLYEASSQALYQHKLDPVINDIGIFTNLSREHLDCHGTMENYFSVKASLLERCKRAVINVDDPYMRRLCDRNRSVPKILCSAEAEKVATSDACALRIREENEGLQYVYFSEKAVFRVRFPQVGRYGVINSLQASAAAMALGVDPMTVKEGLESFRGVDGRMKRLILPDGEWPTVYIDYAHTPSSLASALEALRERTEGKLAVVFGCGGDRDRTKRPHMGAISQLYADHVILTSDNPRTEDPESILKEILSGMDRAKPHAVIQSRKEAIEYALDRFGPGDTVLLAGKGHEKYEITGDGIHPFDEEALVRQATEKGRRP